MTIDLDSVLDLQQGGNVNLYWKSKKELYYAG